MDDIKNGQMCLRWSDNQVFVDTLAEAIDIAMRYDIPILEVYCDGKWEEFVDDEDRTLEDIIALISVPEKDMMINGEKQVFCTRCCEMMLNVDVDVDIDYETDMQRVFYILECPICKMQTTRRSERY